MRAPVPGLSLILAAMIPGLVLQGCATPSHVMGLPSTNRSELLGTGFTAGSLPSPRPDTVNGGFESFNPGDESFLGPSIDWRLRIANHVVIGAELSGTLPWAAQASASLSIQPIEYLICTGWGGVDFRTGGIGGFEAMAGYRWLSVGGGMSIVHPVHEVGDNWNNIPPRWGVASIPYSRLALGVPGFEVSFLLGHRPQSQNPWMFQFAFSGFPLTSRADSIKARWTASDSTVHRGRARRQAY